MPTAESAAAPVVPSYASGTSDVPLLGDTIGDNFDRVVAAQPDHEALVDVPSGRRWTYAQMREDVDTVALGLLAAGLGKGDRVGIWAPNVAEWTLVQYATAKLGVILVNINPAYRTHELEYVLNQAGIALLVAATSFKTSDYAAMIKEVRPNCPALREVVLLGTPDWDALVEAGGRGDRAELARLQTELSPDDPINIQYTSGTTGFPKGATLSHHNILNNGYFVGRLCGYGPDDRVCIPVPFYHCFGMVMGNLGSTTNGSTMVIPGPGFDPKATLEAVQQERCTSLYGVPTMFIAELNHPDVRVLRPLVAAHRDHGGLAVPGGGDEAGRRADGHDRGDDLLRHDRDLARVDPDPGRRHAGPPRVDRRAGAPARRGQGRRPGERPHAAPRRAGRAVHPRLLGDARLLGRAGEDRRRHRPGPLDAHRRHRRDGRRGLRQHHRPHQGHGHPRRGERVPAGDRGVPLQPPRHRRRAGHRGARRRSTARSSARG